jgi:hypothetical protein
MERVLVDVRGKFRRPWISCTSLHQFATQFVGQ